MTKDSEPAPRSCVICGERASAAADLVVHARCIARTKRLNEQQVIRLQGCASNVAKTIRGVIAGMEQDPVLARSQWPKALRVALRELGEEE